MHLDAREGFHNRVLEGQPFLFHAFFRDGFAALLGPVPVAVEIIRVQADVAPQELAGADEGRFFLHSRVPVLVRTVFGTKISSSRTWIPGTDQRVRLQAAPSAAVGGLPTRPVRSFRAAAGP